LQIEVEEPESWKNEITEYLLKGMLSTDREKGKNVMDSSLKVCHDSQ